MMVKVLFVCSTVLVEVGSIVQEAAAAVMYRYP